VTSSALPLLAGLILCLPSSLGAQVTTRTDAVGRLLNEWHAKGQAAGLAAITYENRDGGHSALNAAEYPQLKVFQHTPETGGAKGPAERLRPLPIVGNCSMAAPAASGGSLPRLYQMSPKGVEFLMMQYLASQMFIYPEHQDYDAGGNGVGGYGDLFPVNNATVLITQGSSGSDLPFVNAILATIAALPPDTQEILIQKRVLMPTVQAIFRQTSRRAQGGNAYETGTAHPAVFDSRDIDEERMVRLAHGMTPGQIPPLAQVQVLEESALVSGRHFFEADPDMPWKLADTPVSVGRVLWGNVAWHEMKLSAANSGDLLRRPVQIRWKVLQGDPSAVEITPSADGREARVRVRWQAPFTTAGGIRSHRLDIGVFADNGIAVSAPAFLSFYQLPNERHFHDRGGRVAEILYQTHNPDLGLPAASADTRWLKVMSAVAVKGDGLKNRLMQRLLTGADRDLIQAEWLKLTELAKTAEPARASSALQSALERKMPGDGGLTLRQTLESAFSAAADFTDLYPSFQRELDKLAASSPKRTAAADVRAEVVRLIDLGVLIEEASGAVQTVSPPDRLSEAERFYLRGLNLTLLSEVLFPEALERSTAPAWVDPRLTTPKPWRDIFRYDEKTGALVGWTRHGGGRAAAFDAEGRFLPDGFKHPGVAQPVVYEKGPGGVLTWRVK
jgi:hypothetical protein